MMCWWSWRLFYVASSAAGGGRCRLALFLLSAAADFFYFLSSPSAPSSPQQSVYSIDFKFEYVHSQHRVETFFQLSYNLLVRQISRYLRRNSIEQLLEFFLPHIIQDHAILFGAFSHLGLSFLCFQGEANTWFYKHMEDVENLERMFAERRRILHEMIECSTMSAEGTL